MSSTRPPAPPTARGRQTRSRIVSAAADLLADRGAAAVTLDDVGRATGASRSQLYHYFADRDDLVRAAVAATSDAVLDAQADHFRALDTWSGIDAWFDWMVELQEARQARGGCPIGSLAGQLAEHDPAARQAIADGLQRWEDALGTGLRRLQERGEIPADADPDRLATATMASIQGGLLLTQVRRDPGQLRIALDAARGMLRRGADEE